MLNAGGERFVFWYRHPKDARAPELVPARVPTNRSDLAYMKDLLRLVDARNVAAPAPIEQRWTAGSSARMSPAAGGEGGRMLCRGRA